MTLPETATDRLHGLDAVRAAALLLGICLHAALSFLPGVDPQVWPIGDVRKSAFLGLLTFVIHVFRMSVFFLVSGLLARMLLHRIGLRAFCRNRALRILVPLAVGWMVCYALIIGIVLWALVRTHGQVPEPLPRALTEPGPNFLHLWFLYLLLWLYALALAGRYAWRALDRHGRGVAWADRLLRTTVSSRAGPLLLAAPVALALFLEPGWLVLLGVPAPGYTLLPPAAPLFIYAYVFGIGWLLDRQRALLEVFKHRWPLNFGFGLVGALLAVHFADDPSLKAVHAASYSVALMGWSFAFIGAGVRYFSRPRAAVRYVSDASYWMYLMHLPVVLALQTALMLADWHWAFKYLLINVAAFAILLISYRHAVRPTWVGLVLNGKRRSRGASGEA